MRDQLPLATLPAFEAAARLKSFTLAAKELNLSQAAISRQIKQLEQRLGVDLFERYHRAVLLTANGEQFYRTAGLTLRLLGEAARNLRHESSKSSISIGTDLAFAHFWLIPRLELLKQSSHRTTLSVTASDNEVDCLDQSVDIPIVYGTGNWPGFESRYLLDEVVFPVCSPSYLKTLGKVSEPKDLLKGQLLHVKGGPSTWISWQEWFGSQQLQIPSSQPEIELNSLPWTIQAACTGQGIALGWKHLLDDLIENGTLVRPIPHSISTDRAYYLLFRQDNIVSESFEQVYRGVIDLIKRV